MNIIKRILLTFPAFLASLLLFTTPVQAEVFASASNSEVVLVASVETPSDLTVPHFRPINDPVLDQLGCGCARCVKQNLEMLQGKLPAVNL